VFVAGGWAHRNRAHFANAIRAASQQPEPGPPELTKTETIARLKRLGLIGAGPHVAQPGAPLTYVTTTAFLSVFGLATLRDPPEIVAVADVS
jgi:segregation and condensation protein B